MQTINSKRGFSLVELSVVMVIIGILIYMTLVAGRQQLELARIKQTQFKLQKIQTALAVYYKTYGRLPCPADGSAANSDTANFAVQVTYTNLSSGLSDAKCIPTLNANGLIRDFLPDVYVGVVPTRDLGMPDDSLLDGWGNRITYVVSVHCVDPDNWSATNTYKCIDANVTPNDGSRIFLQGKNGAQFTYNAAILLISHGHSGYGAWPGKGGVKITPGVGGVASNQEYGNGNLSTANGSANTGASTIYYDMPINDGNIAGNYFDNVTAWSTAPQIYYYANH